MRRGADVELQDALSLHRTFSLPVKSPLRLLYDNPNVSILSLSRVRARRLRLTGRGPNGDGGGEKLGLLPCQRISFQQIWADLPPQLFRLHLHITHHTSHITHFTPLPHLQPRLLPVAHSACFSSGKRSCSPRLRSDSHRFYLQPPNLHAGMCQHVKSSLTPFQLCRTQSRFN